MWLRNSVCIVNNAIMWDILGQSVTVFNFTDLLYIHTWTCCFFFVVVVFFFSFRFVSVLQIHSVSTMFPTPV